MEYAVSRLQKEERLDPDMVTVMCYAELSADDAGLLEALDSADQVVILSQTVARNETVCRANECVDRIYLKL